MLSPRNSARLGLGAAFVLLASCLAVIGRGAADSKRLPHGQPTPLQPAVVTPTVQPAGPSALPLPVGEVARRADRDARIAKAH